MSKKIKAPSLPIAANAEAFIRGDSTSAPSKEAERIPLCIKLPPALHRRLKVKLATENLTIQEVGEKLFKAFLGGEADA